MNQRPFKSVFNQALAPTLLTLVALTSAPTAFSQIVDSGRISGTVSDVSGAVVASAPVTFHNMATGLSDKAVTESSGLFVSPPLPPGDYDVTVEVTGFNKEVQHVRLEVAQRAALTITLSPGNATETVNVEAAAPLLAAETTTLSNLRTETAVANLPLDGRNFAELMGLAAGVMPAQTQITGNMALSEVRGATGYSVNGLRMEENHVLLDGISDSENHNGLGIVLFPPLDAVEEFREETSVPDARYGRGGGGTVNLVFKSGTDQFHGDAFEFLRNDDLDARNFFDKSKPAFRMNQFGGTLGGPLSWHKSPSTFFFVDYQGTRTGQGLTFVSTVPTEAYREGNFSAASQIIYNPASQVQLANGTFSRTPFQGNIIPASMINPAAANLMALYPLPNLPGTSNNYLYSPLRTSNEDEGDIRVDHRFSDSDNSFLRYSQASDVIYQPGPLPAPAVGGVISGVSNEPSNQAVLSETHIFSPNSVNSARVGWSRVNIQSSDANTGNPIASALGIPGSNVPGNPLTDGLPEIFVTGATTLGSQGNLPAILVSNNYQGDEDVSLVKGKHTIQIGGEIQRLQYNVFQTNNLRGTMNFTTAYSSDPAAPNGTGLGLADLLLGAPVSGSLQYLDGIRGLRQTQLSFFVQDDYKMTDRLTFNLGVRYENYLGWPWEEIGNRFYAFDPSGAGSVVPVGTNGIPRSGVNNNNLDFMPRVGVAYRATHNTVIRAAYGVFYSAPQIPLQDTPGANPPGFLSTAFTNNQYAFGTANTISEGFSHPSVATAIGSGLTAIPVNSLLPYTQQWNFAIQHQLTANPLLTVAYAGSSGTHLQDGVNENQPVPGLTPIAQRRPYPLYQTITEMADIASSKYNGLQVTAERRLTHGLSFNLAYTWSHALDQLSQNPGSGGQLIMDTYNQRLDYGNSDFNVPQRFVGSATYLLPFKSRGFTRPLVEGWQLNGILSLYSGLPFSVQSASNTLNIGSTSRAEYIGPGNGALPSSQQSIAEWFNVAAYAAPPTLEFGDVGRNTLRGPATRQLDMSLFKNFPFYEGKRNVQLRAEAFNVANTPQFNNPNSTIGAPGVGTITSAGSPYTFQRLSREIQLAIKIYF